MSVAPASSKLRADEMAPRLAARGARSAMVAPAASEMVEREPGGQERRTAVLTEAFRIAICEGALKLAPSHVARASVAIPYEPAPAAPAVAPQEPDVEADHDTLPPHSPAWQTLRTESSRHDAEAPVGVEATSHPSAAWETLKPERAEPEPDLAEHGQAGNERAGHEQAAYEHPRQEQARYEPAGYEEQAAFEEQAGRVWPEERHAQGWAEQDGYGAERREAERGLEEWTQIVSPGWHIEQPRRTGLDDMPEPAGDAADLLDHTAGDEQPGLRGDSLESGPGPRLSPPGAGPGFRPKAQHLALAALIAVMAVAAPLLWGGDDEQAAGSSEAPRSTTLAQPEDNPAPAAEPQMAEVVAPPPETAAAAALPPAPAVLAVAPPEPAVLAVAPPPPAELTPVAVVARPPAAPAAAPPPAEPRVAAAAPAPQPPALPPTLAGLSGLPAALPPRVVVEYPRGDQEERAKAQQVAEMLRDKGMAVVAVSAGGARQPMSVGYSFLQDRPGAEKVASVLGRPWQAREMPAGSGARQPEPGTVRLSLP